MKREIFESKGDLKVLLDEFNIDPDDLIFFERPKGKYPLEKRIEESVFKVGKKEYKLKDKKINLILVDHHHTVPELEDAKLKIIIDHHVLGSNAIHSDIIYVDTTLGSCCTLVSRFLGNTLDYKKSSKHQYFKDEKFCKNLSKMLSIPIIFDTKNFTKVTSESDKEEFHKLEEISGNDLDDISKIVKKMKSERKNDADLSNEIILYKDYKRFDQNNIVFGYSTVKYDYKEWIDRESKKGNVLKSIFINFITDNGLNFLIVNRKFKNQRFLILINCPIEKKLIEKMNLQKLIHNKLEFYEIDVKYSRKVLSPIIKTFLEKVKIK